MIISHVHVYENAGMKYLTQRAGNWTLQHNSKITISTHLAIPKREAPSELNHAGQNKNVPERHRVQLEWNTGPFFGSLYLLLIVREWWVGTF